MHGYHSSYQPSDPNYDTLIERCAQYFNANNDIGSPFYVQLFLYISLLLQAIVQGIQLVTATSAVTN